MDKNINIIKRQITNTLSQMGILIKKIILFGSRARSDFKINSDYDILIITENNFNIKEKMEISEKIRDELVKLRIPTDIIIKSEGEAEYYLDKIGSVTKEALKEGIPL